jgi:N-methylhydantoinase B
MRRRRSIDQIRMQVIGKLLDSAADEMDVALVKTAFSPGIKERADCSTAIFTPGGEMIAQAAHAPIHLGALASLVDEIQTRHGRNAFRPGDIYMTNDPYTGGGSHLNDLVMMAPVFAGRRLVAVVGNIAHHSDVGGAVAGSEYANSLSIYQDGLRVPPVRLARNGVVDPDLVDFFVHNSRLPEERRGDIQAQVGAATIGVRRVLEIVDGYGAPALAEAMAELLDYGERRVRSALRDAPDFDVSAEELLDPDRRGGPVRIAVRAVKRSDAIAFAFAGTSSQVEEGRNVPLSALRASVYYSVKALVDPTLPTNAGYYRAITVTAPPGCLINARPPAAVGTRVGTTQFIVNAIFQALAPIFPTRVISGCDGRRKIIFTGSDPRTGKFFVYYESLSGGSGARHDKDGLSGTMVHMMNVTNLPVEALELEFPLRVERVQLRTDSGGAGRYRGGLGVRRDYRILTEHARMTMIAERTSVPNWGLNAGQGGGLGAFVIDPASAQEQRVDSRMGDIELARDQVASIQTAGAGGYGDPRGRPEALVLADVLEGKVSVEAARRDYGVDVDPVNRTTRRLS